MNRTITLLMALALVFAGSCQRIEESFVQEESVSGDLMTFEATLAEANLFDVSETKTALQSDEKSIYWTPNDQISIFYGASNAGMFWTEITEPSNTASFVGNIGVATGSADDNFVAPTFWGVYPYERTNTCDGESVGLDILGEQVASPGSFGNGMNPSIANSPGLGLSFYNVGSWFRFSVTSEGITSVTFSGNAGEILAGRVTVKMDSNKKPLITNVENGKTSITVTPEGGGSFLPGQLYYITVIPQSIAATGYTITFSNGNQIAECVVSKSEGTYEFARSMYRSKKNADEGLTWRDVLDGYLCFTAVEDGTIALSNSDGNAPDVKYSTDCITWTPWDYSAISVPAGGKVYFKGDNSNGFSSSSKYSSFVMTGKFAASGSVQSLLYGDNYEDNLTIPSESEYCFLYLFKDCTSLTTAPELPATTLAPGCYDLMFCRCTSLETAPDLPAATLTRECYAGMFMGCKGLISAPALPATTLAPCCYEYMFMACERLRQAPELPARILVDECYEHMFELCNNLIYIKMMATDASATGCLDDWVKNVSSWGTFVKNPALSLGRGASGIPEGWDVDERIPDYLCLTAVEDGTISLSNTGGNAPDVKYSTDGISWTQWNYSAISVPAGGKVYFKGDNSNGFSSSGNSKFVMTGKFAASGSVQSLLYDDDFENNLTIPSENCFASLFESCPITTAPKLPATTLADYCYSKMFYHCIYLTAAPELPAETLAKYCYRVMFMDCPSLSVAPELPATIMAYGCYNDMFRQCTSLVTAPELPGTTLAYACYRGMFSECTSLVSAPDLPAATLARECYASMFKNCSNLSYIKIMATAVSGSDCLSDWVSGVASSGTFVKNFNFSLDRGVSGIPEGWELQQFIEMGDGLKWAIMNVGASSIAGYGDYFAWGETQPKTNYSSGTYFDKTDSGFNKYALDKKTQLELTDDAARVNLGGTWRIPTSEEWLALKNSNNFDWVWNSASNGYEVTSKIPGYSGKSIFLPAAGMMVNTSGFSVGSVGNYWTSTLSSNDSGRAYEVNFNSSGVDATNNSGVRSYGRPVRAVFD